MNKVYIWEDVFTDYTSGMAVAVAPTIREARALVASAMHPITARMPKAAIQRLLIRHREVVAELTSVKPTVIRPDNDRGSAYYVTGGG